MSKIAYCIKFETPEEFEVITFALIEMGYKWLFPERMLKNIRDKPWLNTITMQQDSPHLKVSSNKYHYQNTSMHIQFADIYSKKIRRI